MLNEKSNVRLTIINSVGEEKIIFNDIKTAGRYEINLDAKLFTPGIYFAVVRNDRGEKSAARFVVAR